MTRTSNKRRKFRRNVAARRMEVATVANALALEQQQGEAAAAQEEEDNEDDEQLVLTDYEKQRQQRIKENAARLAALKLPSLSSVFQRPQHRARQKSPPAVPRRSGRRKKSNDNDVEEEDDDYRPSDDGSNSETGDSDDEEARPRTKRLQQSASYFLDQDANGDDDEDRAFQQALALSLEDSMEHVVEKSRSNAKRIDGGDEMKSYMKGGKNDKSRRDRQHASNSMPKRQKKGWKEQLQFTDDEITTFFSLIDEKGKGKFSVTELEHAARSHDFTWTKQEIFDMIDIFDNNKDGQLDLSEFRGVFVLGNMMKTP